MLKSRIWRDFQTENMAQVLAAAGSSNSQICGTCELESRSRCSRRWSTSVRMPAERVSMRFGSHIGQALVTATSQKQRPGRTGTVFCAEADGFFESSIVKNEMDRLQADYQDLLELGRRYGQFDREGKKSYISEMKDVIERWQIFYKRMELSDDFTAKICAKQLKAAAGPLGLSNLDLVKSLYASLDEMTAEADGGQ